MRTQGKHSRRSRGDKGLDDEQYLDSRGSTGDEIRPSRSLHPSPQSQGYMSHSSRGSYEGDREPSSSRSHRDNDSWRRGEPPHDRYDYSSGYRRGRRTDYTPATSRDNWRTRHEEPSFPESRDDWSQHYEQSYATTNYPESTWNPKSLAPYESRSGTWRTDEERDHSHEEHIHVIHEDKPTERGSSGWHRDQRRERGKHRFQNDSGLHTRRRGKEWDETSRWDESSSPSKRNSDENEDRSWEPGPSWQRSNRDQPVPYQNGHRHNHKQSKGIKKHSQQKQKRDWRNDDNNLNKYASFTALCI
jgi:hypothetical protein